LSSLNFKQVDVFTQKPFRGNPVAVVIGAGTLSSEEMQRIQGSSIQIGGHAVTCVDGYLRVA
jgi:predicted PhzF superfamily epimerase YddE/YHI9